MSDDEADDDILFLSAENKDDVMGQYAAKYILAAAGDKPRCAVMIRSVSFSRVDSFRRASEGKDEKKKLRELCELIGESVVDELGDPVWAGRDVLSMAQGNTQRFMELQKGCLQHNGLTKEGKDLEELQEEERKK